MYYYKMEPGGSVYVAVYDSTSPSTNLQSVFSLVAGSSTRVVIEEIRLARVTGAVNPFGVYLYRGSTSAQSTSYGDTPSISGWTGQSTATSKVNIGSTILPSTTSAVLLDAWGTASGNYDWQGWGDLILVPGQRFDVVGVQLSPTSSDVDFHATIRFREIGKGAVS